MIKNKTLSLSIFFVLQVVFLDAYGSSKKVEEKIDKEVGERMAEKDLDMQEAFKERDKAKADLAEMKLEWSNKMSQIKIMEQELEEKLAEANEREDGDGNNSYKSDIDN